MPPKSQEQVQGGVLTKNATKFSSMRGVYGNMTERFYLVDTVQHGAVARAMALAEVQHSSKNIPRDVTKLARWGSGEISIVIHIRTLTISCKRQVMDDMKLPALYGAQ